MEDYIEGLVMSNDSFSSSLREEVYVEMCHGVAVSNFARALAQELNKDKKFCDDISIAGLLHDIGKMKIVNYLDHVEEETLAIERMKYVRMHPTHSYDILKKAKYPENICEAVYFHHENYDGSGYPENRKAEQIPIMARILRTCDVFCALTSDRRYRRAFDKKTALQIMIDEVEDYDMEVFLAFQKLIHSQRFVTLSELRTEITVLQKKNLGLFMDAAKEVQQ